MFKFTPEEAINRLKSTIGPDERVLVNFWSEDDFQMLSEQEHGVRLTDEELVLAMNRVESAFDSTIGINWDVIDVAIESVLAKRENQVEA